MRRLIPLTVVLALFLVLSCDQQPVEPPDQTLAAEPQLNFMNNPDNPNPRIYRFEDHFMYFFSDVSNGLRAGHTTLPLSDPGCGALEVFEPLDFQNVEDINEDEFLLSRIHQLFHGEVFIVVRDETQEGDCFEDRLVATGMGTVKGTDNDVIAWYPYYVTGEFNDRHNANAFGFSAHGVLTAPDGSVYKYNGVHRVVWEDERGLQKETSKIKLH